MIFIALLLVAAAAIPFIVSADGALQGSISGRVTAVNNVPLTGAQVILVNASNTSQTINNFSATPDSNGYFLFTGVPAGNYKAYAWAQHLSGGESSSINVSDNVTYTCAVVLVPEPYYANMSVSRNPIYLEGDKAQITVTLYDFWNNRLADGWLVSLNTTAGLLDPPYGLTTPNGQFTTTLTSPTEGSYAEVTAFARARNGTYYPLVMRLESVNLNPTATPTAAPTVTPTAGPSASPSPPVPTQSTTATPSATPTATATPTPGFELLAAIVAIGALGLAFRFKK